MRKGEGSLGCRVHPCRFWHRRIRKMKQYYLGGGLNSLVVEWLDKGLMAAWSPKARAPDRAQQGAAGLGNAGRAVWQ
eukprot:2350137-Pyramimonas_sp.AAC.1